VAGAEDTAGAGEGVGAGDDDAEGVGRAVVPPPVDEPTTTGT
jgi:hypothetical protein